MPYDIETHEGEDARAKAADQGRLGAQCPADRVEAVARVVLVGSSFSDPGEDWTRWDCFNAAGEIVHSRAVPGY